MSARRNIVFLTSWFPHDKDPTLGIFVMRHAKAVHTKNNVCIVHVRGVSNQDKNFEVEVSSEEEITVIRITYNRWEKFPILKSLINWERYFVSHQLAWKAMRAIDFEPNLLHLNVSYPAGIIAYIWKKFRKLPYLITEHWTGYLTADNRFNKSLARKKLTPLIVNNANVVVPVSEDLKKAFENLKMGKAFDVVPNVVDTNFFHINRELTKRKMKFTVVADLYNPQKNISGILDAFREVISKYPETELHILGDGESRLKIEAKIQALEIDKNVILHGRTNPLKVKEHLQESKALVMFSNFENQPCVIIEAFACGTPVIATDVGGIKEHLNDELGVLIKANDTPALQEAMESMLRNNIQFEPSVLRDYAKKHFSSTEVGLKFDDLYRKYF